MTGWLSLIGFIATVPLANWLIGNAGTVCVPQGPCLIPVGFGLTAPSGVLVVGVAFVLRDLVQRELGPRWALVAILIGGCLSAALAPPALVLASVTAYLAAELADFAVYTPLARRRFFLAVIASSLVGLALDSALFLWLAFGSLNYLPGQIVGKLWAVLAATGMLWIMQRRNPPTEPA